MPTKRELKRIARLEKIKARKEAASLPHPVESADTSAPDGAVVAVLPEIVANPAESAPAAIILSRPKFADDGPGVEGLVIRRAKVYAKPFNVRMRLIEFDDGSHGKLWVRPDSAPMLSWVVWVKPSGLVKGDWELHGRYNGRGTRVQ